MKHQRYAYNSVNDFLADTARLENGLPFSTDTSILSSPAEIDGKIIRNRLLAQPIEGFDSEKDGSPSQRAYQRYQSLADGGVGTIWMESISVNAQGKSNDRQMCLSEANVAEFQRFLAEIRNHRNPFLVGQLTHSGRYSKSVACAIENPLIPKENSYIISDEELDSLAEDYIKAALLAKQAGFDAVDIRCCHGYLLNELFSAYNRPGKYGGTYENRTRLVKDIVCRIREKSDITLAVRLNVFDGLPYPYGWGCRPDSVLKQDMSEPLRLIGELRSLGVSLFNISAGIGAVTPYMIRPYDTGGPIPEEHPLEGVERLLQSAKMVKSMYPDVCVVASGFTWLRDFAPNVAAGGIEDAWFDLAGFGRQWVADPSFANALLNGGYPEKQCATCGGCTALIKQAGKAMQCVRTF